MMTTLSISTPQPEATPAAGWALWRSWTLATTAGELVGFVAPALAGVLITRAFATPGDTSASLLILLVLVLAGSIEGATLGFAQWLALQRALPAITWQRWTGATALAASLAWLLGMLPNTIGDLTGSTVLMMIGWVAVAPALLVSIGVGQWLVLRQHVARAARWIPANALAWTLGLVATFVGPMFISETTPVPLAVAIGVASGVLMGAVVGAITGLSLVRLLRPAT